MNPKKKKKKAQLLKLTTYGIRKNDKFRSDLGALLLPPPTSSADTFHLYHKKRVDLYIHVHWAK